MNQWLERLGGFSVRWCWAVIIAWVIILGGLLAANRQWGGTYVNNYNVPGTPSADGLNMLNATFPAQGGYAGQIVFHARTGTLTGDSAAINQATANVAALPHVIKAVSPFSSPSGGAVSKNGTESAASGRDPARRKRHSRASVAHLHRGQRRQPPWRRCGAAGPSS